MIGKVGEVGVVDAPVWEGILRLPQESFEVGVFIKLLALLESVFIDS